jgi:hypothetical protein
VDWRLGLRIWGRDKLYIEVVASHRFDAVRWRTLRFVLDNMRTPLLGAYIYMLTRHGKYNMGYS